MTLNFWNAIMRSQYLFLHECNTPLMYFSKTSITVLISDTHGDIQLAFLQHHP